MKGIGTTTAIFAVTTYPVTVQGGTGRFDGATGVLENIGEVLLNPADFAAGRTVFRYSGTVCSRTPFR